MSIELPAGNCFAIQSEKKLVLLSDWLGVSLLSYDKCPLSALLPGGPGHHLHDSAFPPLFTWLKRIQGLRTQSATQAAVINDPR